MIITVLVCLIIALLQVSASDVKKVLSFDLNVRIEESDDFAELVNSKRDVEVDINNKRDAEVVINNSKTRYTLDIWVGSNKQRSRVSLDTGSSECWVLDYYGWCDFPWVCAEKLSFNAFTSTTFNNLSSRFDVSYLSGTYGRGYYGKEDILLSSGDRIKQLQIGVATTTDRSIGLLGIGLRNGNVQYETFPYALKKQGIIQKAAYSLYLGHSSSKTGKVIFGGYDTTKFIGAFPELPIISSEQIEVKLDSVRTGEMNTIIESNCLLDSGFSFIKFKSQHFWRIMIFLQAEWNEAKKMYLFNCNQPSDKYISFKFRGANIKVPFSDLVWTKYIVDAYDGAGACATVIRDGGDYTSMGDVFLRNAYVVYNLEDMYIRMGQARHSTDENVVEID